jgi:hypothetical protein
MITEFSAQLPRCMARGNRESNFGVVLGGDKHFLPLMVKTKEKNTSNSIMLNL